MSFGIQRPGKIGLEGNNEPTKGCISYEVCVINHLLDVPSARETTTIWLNRYNTKKEKNENDSKET